MHPGGGGDVLNPEISSQEAAAMVAAAAQHQCLQLSLGRNNPAGDPGSSRTALLVYRLGRGVLLLLDLMVGFFLSVLISNV